MVRRFLFVVAMFAIGSAAVAGFKVKLVKPKKAGQFQASNTVEGVTFAADLLMSAKEQKDFFYKELTASNVIAVRLAVFNSSNGEVTLPLDLLELVGPDGKALAPVSADTVAEAVLQGLVVSAESADERKVAVSPNVRYEDPRYDRTDPRYDPRLDPSDPTYDPRDPRNRDGRNRGYSRYPRPGIDVVLNPGAGGGAGGDLSQFEKQLVEKDFRDKAHPQEPIPASFSRDRFLYFSLPAPASSATGYTLRIPEGKGVRGEVVLRF